MDHELVKSQLLAIRAKHGTISAETVLEEASSATSPLHEHFTWDDSQAAHAHRLDQARTLIRSVRIWVNEPEPKRVRAFVNVDAGEHGPRQYLPTVEALSAGPTREIVLRKAWQEAAAFRRKYAELEELANVVAAIDETLTEGAA